MFSLLYNKPCSPALCVWALTPFLTVRSSNRNRRNSPPLVPAQCLSCLVMPLVCLLLYAVCHELSHVSRTFSPVSPRSVRFFFLFSGARGQRSSSLGRQSRVQILGRQSRGQILGRQSHGQILGRQSRGQLQLQLLGRQSYQRVSLPKG